MELFRWTRRNYFVRFEKDIVVNMYDFFDIILKILPHEEMQGITEYNTIAIVFESIFSGQACRIKIDYNVKGGYANKAWDLSWDKVGLLNREIIQKLIK